MQLSTESWLNLMTFLSGFIDHQAYQGKEDRSPKSPGELIHKPQKVTKATKKRQHASESCLRPMTLRPLLKTDHSPRTGGNRQLTTFFCSPPLLANN
jgi:hypothetical protein